MTILFLILLGLIILYTVNYDNMSYKRYYERQVINSKHPDWKPYCGINYLERDPQWFIENGYKDWVK